MAYWNSKIETMPIKELKALQLKNLKALVRRLYDNSPFYRLRMEQKGVVPDDVRTLDDVVKLPFMYKKDLRDYYPDKLFIAPRREIVRYHASSGTTGKATIVGYTKNDIESWSESLARALTSIGLNSEDVVQVANTYVIHEDRCSCGRTHPRISRITGRVDDMLIIRGINVFPSQVEYSLLTNPELGNEFQIVIDRKGALDDMLVRAELKPEAFTDNINQLNALKERVEGRLKDLLNVGVEIELVEPGSLPRFEGKAKRVVDRRVY